MLFQINSMWQLLGWVLVFAGLVILNEIERRTKLGGYGIFVGVLAILTVYFFVSVSVYDFLLRFLLLPYFSSFDSLFWVSGRCLMEIPVNP